MERSHGHFGESSLNGYKRFQWEKIEKGTETRW
jgi:hypothetical protein